MKPSKRYLILAGFFVSFVLISCKTTGADIPSSLVDNVVIQEALAGPASDYVLEALAQAKETAKEARSWAEYMNGPVHCSDEWDAAEGRFETASSRSGDPETLGEAYDRIQEWYEIKLAYDDIFKGSFIPFQEEQKDVLAKAREKAVEAGAEELVPDRFAVADACAADSGEKMENGDVYGSLNAGKEAWDRYRILETLALAHAKQVEADENDLFSVDPDNYMLAAEAGNNAVEFYDEGNLVKSQAAASEALSRFNLVLGSVLLADAEEYASAARQLRDAALEIKADVAVKTDFAAAETVYNQAHAALRAEKYSEAIGLFEQSGELFIAAYDNALEKREIAEDALSHSEQMLAESEEYAQNVEAIIEGGE